jgi:superfamily II DNA or RNA helicase
MPATFPPGVLVKARGREWVVLPESSDTLLRVRPIGGLDDEIVGIQKSLEPVTAAAFSLPTWERPGDFNSCRLLYDAARLSTRSAAGPFRSFGKIAVDPRPYQLVPLLMAMRLDPVRLLIADDVGVGKTVEACLVAKELIERGEVTRMAVLCPPHLAEQWHRELAEKFHLEAELVLSSTVRRLERGLQPGESVYQRYPVIIVSTDFIKSPRHRSDFLRECPELVIVDEAHGCTVAGGVGRSRQARFELVRDLAASGDRHLVLVTATPHSGNEAAFRSLLSHIDPRFADLPHDLESDARSTIRAQLAKHLVQRRRADVVALDKELHMDTTFPDRDDAEESYAFTDEYKRLFQKVRDFACEMVRDDSGTTFRRRVRWWSALALLRSMASSPAAASATLRNRSATAAARDDADADEVGRRGVLDLDDVEDADVIDVAPGGNPSGEDNRTTARLLGFAREADKLHGKSDQKLQQAITLTKQLISDGYHPIVFCRFIPTAEYVGTHLRDALTNVDVAVVTGTLPPKEREDRIEKLGTHDRRVLVCTDCLSEGINLQMRFDSVLHYDLSWNPTRHEQREGRVDRFGQPKKTVRVLTYFGVDNQIDGVILNVLLRKHKTIKSDLGVSVAVPGNTESVVKALFEGMELRGLAADDRQIHLPGLEPTQQDLHAKWDDAREKEKRSRSRFAQHAINTGEVQVELDAIRRSIGAGPTVARFVHDVLHLAGVPVVRRPHDTVEVTLSNQTPRALRHAIGHDTPLIGRFNLPVDEGVIYLSRTHPIVEGLAAYTLETALDAVQADGAQPVASRCGVAATQEVSTRTSILVVRVRYHLEIKRSRKVHRRLVAEEVLTRAFTGSPDTPTWLNDSESLEILDCTPSGNLLASLVRQQLQDFVGHLPAMRPQLETLARERADLLQGQHTRVRRATRMAGAVEVAPVEDVDILGCYILLPATA